MIDKAPILAIPPKAFGDKHFAAEFNKFRMFLLSLADEANKRALGYTGSLRISDPMPTIPGLYKLLEFGTYTNLIPAVDNSGNTSSITAVDGKVNEAYYDGSKWVNSKITLPSSNAIAVFDPTDNTNPSTMKAAAGRYDSTLTVLNSFLTLPGDEIKKEYKWADADQSIFGINSQSGLLQRNNTFAAYTESGTTFRVWMNVPVSDFDFLDIKLVRVGGASNSNNVSLIAKKANGDIVVLIQPNSDPATRNIESFTFSISEYSSLSFCLINFTSNNAGLNTDIKFIKKGGLLEQDAVKKYIDANTAGLYFGLIDVDKEGAKGDGITDDTNVINSCVNKLIAQGGGNILFHARTYIVSQINIPNVTNWYTIGFIGAFIPAQRFGTITARPQYPPDYSKPNGTIIKGNSNTVSAVIFGQPGTSYQNFNTAFLSIENITVRTSVENPNISGIDASNLFQLYCKNVVIDTGVYNVDAIEPTHDKSGLITPKNQNCALTKLDNMSISGFTHGIRVFEHTNGNSLQIQSCKNALTFEAGDHASYFTRCCFQRNTIQVNVVGQHVFEIAQLNMEYAGVGQTTPENAWQSTQFELNDPNNLGIGNITYANVKGGLGKVATWRMNGGNGIVVKRIGNETRITTTIPSP